MRSGTNKAQEQDIAEPNSRSQSITASPAQHGIKAPPSTPATGAVASNPTVGTLEPIDEDGSDILRTIANSSNLNLSDSKHAQKNYRGGRVGVPTTKFATMPARHGPTQYFSNPFEPLAEAEPMTSPEKRENENSVTKYQDDVIAKFLKEKTPEVESHVDAPRRDDAHQPSAAGERGSGTEPFPVLEELDVLSSTAGSNNKVTQSTVDTPETVRTATSNPAMTVTAASEDGKGGGATEKEDREHMTHFKSWGTPTPRDRAAARVRTIILRNLPADSDLTLVQSLIYGGAIDTFHLSLSKINAYVTFVSADACDKFYNTHPNGIVFKNPKTRRNHVVYVEKGDNVDVVSSILQAYLDCQASRLVRATGADEDWGMRALYKLAESKNRKVENIVDTYRDKVGLHRSLLIDLKTDQGASQVRTIIFRFTNIADAVTFRHQLTRDEDWDMCNIQFMDDPTKKATGVHLEE
jgi:hypothetical protein